MSRKTIVIAEVKAARRYNHAAIQMRKARFYDWAATAKSMSDLAMTAARAIRSQEQYPA